MRTSARLLYDVLTFVYDRLGFDIIDDPVFQDLVIARIVEPTSKIDALRVLDDLGAVRNRCPTKRFKWYALEACRPFESAEHDEDGGLRRLPVRPCD